MYPDSMTLKELEERIDVLTVRVEYLESGLCRRSLDLVEREKTALYMALSDLHEEKSKRNK